eukprot:s2142_g6.t1
MHVGKEQNTSHPCEKHRFRHAWFVLAKLQFRTNNQKISDKIQQITYFKWMGRMGAQQLPRAGVDTHHALSYNGKKIADTLS